MSTVATGRHASGNLRSIVAILAASVLFTIVDVILKLVTTHMPVGEAIVIRNSLATILIVVFGLATGTLSIPKDAQWKRLSWRMVGEGGSTITFLSALAVMPIADAAGIAQFIPLAITAAAALFLGEHVGWRRWMATVVGFAGVMLIVRPGTGAFSPASLLALGSIAFIVLRDLATRGVSTAISTVSLAAMSSAATLAAGLALLPFETWVTPSLQDLVRLAFAGIFLLGGYACMVITMRHGEVSAATPFRYAGMVTALAAGWIIWSEIPDTPALIGIAMVCVAGLYTLRREGLHRPAATP